MSSPPLPKLAFALVQQRLSGDAPQRPYRANYTSGGVYDETRYRWCVQSVKNRLNTRVDKLTEYLNESG